MSEVNIRFYAELNDFLPRRRRYKTLNAGNSHKRSVKDLIESFGVPHTEVDLIVVNGVSRPFDYQINPGDFISVYPVFESLDIKDITLLRARPLRSVRFILDAHLGKLARYIRMLGFDSVYENDISDDRIIAQSIKDRRIILTRDLGILKNGKVSHGYFIRSQYPKQQVEEVVRRFDLAEDISPFKRCLICNGILNAVEKNKIAGLIPDKAARYYDNFFQCSSCGKLYWEGSHVEDMSRFIARLRKIRLSGK